MDEIGGKGTILNACYMTVSAVLVGRKPLFLGKNGIRIRTYPFHELSDSIWGTK